MLKAQCWNQKKPSSFVRTPPRSLGIGISSPRWFRKEKYDTMRKDSLQSREEFWDHAASDIFWFKKYQKAFDASYPEGQRWFRGFRKFTLIII